MARCDNCGTGSFEKECRKCGYKVIATVVLDPGTIVYCDVCGCHFWNVCANGHPTVPVELNKKAVARK